MHEIIPEGESPLYTEVTLRSISKWHFLLVQKRSGLGWPMQWRKPNGNPDSYPGPVLTDRKSAHNKWAETWYEAWLFG